MNTVEKCPKCGAEAKSQAGDDWKCGTYVAHDSEGQYLDESKQCLHNQLAASEQEKDALKATLIERLTCQDCKHCSVILCTLRMTGLGLSDHKHSPCSDFIPRDKLKPLIGTTSLPFPPFEVVMNLEVAE
jgi:hypothetical protein